MSDNKELLTPAESSEATNYVSNTNSTSEKSISINLNNILQWGLYGLGIVLIIMSIVKYNSDLDTYAGEYKFDEVKYVGGDAYNYIISAARSTAVMIKSLILAVLGSSSIISGLLIKSLNK